MIATDETYRLRAEDRDALDEFSRAPGTPGAGNGKLLVRTAIIDTYPPDDDDHINVYFGAEVLEILNDAATGTGAKILVYNCGSKWPPLGTVIDATEVPYAWVIRYQG